MEHYGTVWDDYAQERSVDSGGELEELRVPPVGQGKAHAMAPFATTTACGAVLVLRGLAQPWPPPGDGNLCPRCIQATELTEGNDPALASPKEAAGNLRDWLNHHKSGSGAKRDDATPPE